MLDHVQMSDINRLLKSKFREEIDRHQAIAFDVFDTLLVRRAADPHDVFQIVAGQLDAPDFVEARIDAEKNARKKNKRDISLKDIYAQNQELSSEGMSLELAVEEHILVQNRAMKKVYDYCLQTGHRIFILANSYFTRDFAEKALKSGAGYSGWDKLYISCEEDLSEFSGSLLKKCVSDNQIQPDDFLYIGSNAAEIRKLHESGIHTFLCERPFDYFIGHDSRAGSLFNLDHSLASHSLLGMIGSKFSSWVSGEQPGSGEQGACHAPEPDIGAQTAHEQEERDYWFKFGYTFAGPAVTAFTAWIADQAKSHHVDRVLFVGRDGYVLTKIFGKFWPKIQNQYIFAPRYVYAACAAKSALDSDLGLFSASDLSTLIDTFVSRGWLPESMQIPVFNNDYERRFFLREQIDNVREHVDDIIGQYQIYLKSLNLDQVTGKVAVVDSCSINLSSQKIITYFLPKAEVSGLYWVIPRGHAKDDLESFPCATFQPERKQQIINWNLMEWIMTAPYPGVAFIADGKVEFNASHPNEQERNRLYPLMEKGMLEFADDVGNTFGNPSLLANVRTMVLWINQFCSKPTSADRKYFSHIKHAPDAASRKWEDCMRCWNIESDGGKAKFFKYRLLNAICFGKVARFKERCERYRSMI